MSTTFDEKQIQRIIALGKRTAINDRENWGYNDEDGVRKRARAHAWGNVDQLGSGGDDPTGYVDEFAKHYVKGYFDEVKFHESLMEQGKRWSAERKEQQEQAIAAMTPAKAAEIVHAASEIIGIEHMPMLAQLEIVEKWLKRMEAK